MTNQKIDTVTIVACGESARDWQPNGYSIGVNDAWKWGKPTDALVVCNRPEQFAPDRFNTIINSKPEDFYSWKSNWAQWFPNWNHIPMVTWYGTLNPWQVYSSNTSPFIAISLACTLGARDIILWGVDFKTHHCFNGNNTGTLREVQTYLELINAMKEYGVKVWIGAKGTAFDELLPVYES